MTNVSVGADGSVWGVNQSGQIWRFNESTNLWDSVSGPETTGLTLISNGGKEQVWGVGANDTIWRWTGSGWDQVPGGLLNIAVGSDGTVWGVNRFGEIYRRNSSGWDGVGGGLKQISVGKALEVWGVNVVDEIYRWTGSTWSRIAGGLSNVAVGADGTVWGVNASGEIWGYYQTANFVKQYYHSDECSGVDSGVHREQIDLPAGYEYYSHVIHETTRNPRDDPDITGYAVTKRGRRIEVSYYAKNHPDCALIIVWFGPKSWVGFRLEIVATKGSPNKQ